MTTSGKAQIPTQGSTVKVLLKKPKKLFWVKGYFVHVEKKVQPGPVSYTVRCGVW
eukprot:Pgem_evm1s7831